MKYNRLVNVFASIIILVSAASGQFSAVTWKGGNGSMAINTISSMQAKVPTWKDGANGAYSITLDDFGEMPFNFSVKPAWDLVRESGFEDIKMAWGIIAGSTPDNVWDSAVAMVSQGHEMLNHSMTHTSALSWGTSGSKINIDDANSLINQKIYQRINTAGEYFAKGKRCEFFIFPFDEFNDGNFAYLDNAGFVGARGGDRGTVILGDFTYNRGWDNVKDQFQIPFFVYYCPWEETQTGNTAGLNQALDEIIKQNGYAVRELHSVVDTDASCDDINAPGKVPGGWWGAITKNRLRTHLNYVKEKIASNELTVYTPSEAVKYRKTALAFKTDAVLTSDKDNWVVKLNLNSGQSVSEKYREEISVIVNLGTPISRLAVAYDRNPLNTDADNSPRRKPKPMNMSSGKASVWSVSINPFKTSDYSALLIRDGEWFGQDVAIERTDNPCEISISGWTYGQPANIPSVVQTPADYNGLITFNYKGQYALDNTYSTDLPANAGPYTVRATFAETIKYFAHSATANFIITKAYPYYTVPDGLTATIGQTLADVTLMDGWSWINDAISVGAAGTRTHKARFTPNDTANYEVADDIDVTVTVFDMQSPVIDIKKSDNKYGILFEKSVVSDNAKMRVVLPNDKVSQVKMVISDNLGNVVFSSELSTFVWNLTNNSGRYVANGTYLVVAEVKGVSGKVYMYSTKIGVKK